VAASHLANLPAWAGELLESEPVARLGLLDDRGHPRVLPITFALAGGHIWTAVDEKPKTDPGRELARVRFIRRDPRGTITVDRYSEDWDALAWVQVLGRMSIFEGGEAPEGQEALVAKYEPYRESPPPGPLLALEPKRVICWQASR
jgi:PPOX class probable F420-dependent enzyme